MLIFLKSLLQTPRFASGARVNRFLRGQMDRVDGWVVTQTHDSVLVEWPRFGARWEHADSLSLQV